MNINPAEMLTSPDCDLMRYMRKSVYGLLFAGIVVLSAGWTNALANTSFDGISLHSSYMESGVFKLTNGVYQEQVVPGAASYLTIRVTDKTVVGKLDNRGVALLILSIDPGGSGTFYELKVLSDEDGNRQEIVSRFLGDRIKIEELAITDNFISIAWRGRAAGEPMTGTGLLTRKTFLLQGWNLQEISSVSERVEERKNDCADNIALTDRLWTWKKSEYNNDTSAEPPETQSYTLKLLPDGNVAAKVDCNRGGGVYRVDGNKLSIDITHTTRAYCADSLDSVFLKDVQEISSYFFRDDTLYLELKYDSGVIFFE